MDLFKIIELIFMSSVSIAILGAGIYFLYKKFAPPKWDSEEIRRQELEKAAVAEAMKGFRPIPLTFDGSRSVNIKEPNDI
jgi:hypothetical protein